MYSNETDALLATGGLKQEGGMVDEESGNEVPTGSTREEVRDDIDAKLSPGEFVFPADVVRYFGLAKLMEMRDEAKQGLQKMEDIGQMGNAADVENADALHGEEMEKEEPEEPEEPAAFAAGGYVGGARSAALYKRSPIKGFEMVPMEDNNGNTIYIPYINGEPQLNVPAGYRVKTAASATPATPVTPVTPPTTTTFEDRGGGNDAIPTGTKADDGFDTTGKGYTIDIGGFAQPDKINTGVAKAVGFGVGLATGIPMLSFGAGKLAEYANTRNAAAAKAYNDLVESESLGGAYATRGPLGTGGAAASLGKSIADNIYSSGLELTPEAIAAATQAAATSTITGANPGAALVQAASALAITANIDPAYALDIVTGSTAKSTPVAEQTQLTGTPLGPVVDTTAPVAPTTEVATTSPVTEQASITGAPLGTTSVEATTSPVTEQSNITGTPLGLMNAPTVNATPEALSETSLGVSSTPAGAQTDTRSISAPTAPTAPTVEAAPTTTTAPTVEAAPAAPAVSGGGDTSTSGGFSGTLGSGISAADKSGEGGGGDGGGGGCFLTTAAVEHMRQKDNGEVLNTLRHFRDTYMKRNKEANKDIAWYYENAPKIVRALDKHPDADKIYKRMYIRYIEPAYRAISKGDEERAYDIYKKGINFAKEESGIERKALTNRY